MCENGNVRQPLRISDKILVNEYATHLWMRAVASINIEDTYISFLHSYVERICKLVFIPNMNVESIKR